MKKVFIGILITICVFLCGCSSDVSYQTKYITNCTSTEFREEPSNSATILTELYYGDAVSFEKDEKNGYSKVAYNGLNGYVLSSMLSDEKPDADAVPQQAVVTQTQSVPELSENSNFDYLISNMSHNQIENQINNYIRPTYLAINNQLDSYSKRSTEEGNVWYDGDVIVKREIPQGALGYNMTRQYYYDSATGQLLFAFFFRGTQEYRFYFSDGEVIRYIDSADNIVNNPTGNDALTMADRAITEAY